MGELSYTTAEIQSRLDAVPMLGTEIGTLSSLNTSAKDNLVDAVNELFTSAREGKNGAVAVLTAHGVDVSATDSWGTIGAAMETWASGIETDGFPHIVNGTAVVPSGNYATAAYYNLAYGVKLGYMGGGDVLLSMMGGTNANYEGLYFNLVSAPAGVTIEEVHNTSGSYASMKVGLIFACVLHGVNSDMTMAISMTVVDATGDTVRVDITLTDAYHPKIVNRATVVPTGTYANSTYYNTSFGVKIGYMETGDILLAMKGGTNADYEYLYFNLKSAPTGVTLTEVHNTATGTVTALPGLICACVISGAKTDMNMELAMNTINASYDYTQIDITLTAVT